MASVNKLVVIEAIVKALEKGTVTEKICAVICSKFQFSERTFYNHLKIAQQQHAEKQNAIKKELAKVDKQMAIKARKREIMTTSERKVLLTKIAKGEVKIPFKEAKWDHEQKKFKMLSFVELPNHAARIKAIAELNLMEGDYAPAKIAQTDTFGNDVEVSSLSAADLKTLLDLKHKINK